MFKIVFRDSSLNPKQLFLFCLLWLSSANIAKTLVWKTWIWVKLWRHRQRTPNTNDHHMPLNDPPWKCSACAIENVPRKVGEASPAGCTHEKAAHEVGKGPSGVTTSPTLLCLVLVWIQHNYQRLMKIVRYSLSLPTLPAALPWEGGCESGCSGHYSAIFATNAALVAWQRMLHWWHVNGSAVPNSSLHHYFQARDCTDCQHRFESLGSARDRIQSTNFIKACLTNCVVCTYPVEIYELQTKYFIFFCNTSIMTSQVLLCNV